jgi:hypothetical protein
MIPPDILAALAVSGWLLSLLLALAFWMERTLHRAAREDADFWAARAFKLDAELREAKERHGYGTPDMAGMGVVNGG